MHTIGCAVHSAQRQGLDQFHFSPSQFMHNKCVYVSASFGGRFVDKKGEAWLWQGAGGAGQAQDVHKISEKYSRNFFH